MDEIAHRIRSLWTRIEEVHALGRRIRVLSVQLREQERRVGHLVRQVEAHDREVTRAIGGAHRERDQDERDG